MFRNIGIGLRAALFFSAIGLLVILIGTLSLVQQSRMNTQKEVIVESAVPAMVAINGIERDFLRARVYTGNLISTTNENARNRHRQDLEQAKAEMDTLKSHYRTLISTAEGERLYAEFEALDRRYWQGNQNIQRIATQEGSDAALLARERDLAPLVEEMSTTLNNLVNWQRQLVAQADGESNRVSGQATILIWVIMLIAISLVAVLAVIFTRSIIRPMSTAVSTANTIAEGDLTRLIEPTGDDEVTRLLEALARMQGNLRDSIGLIADSASQLASTSEELSSVTEDSNRSLHEQSAELEQAATAVNELTAAVEEVARNAQAASEESVNADEQAQYGRERVGLTVSNIENLVKELASSAENIENLAAKVNNITSVLDVIGSIAEQTNLLALNAAIEAARAGESGRGFAVVADEVRALAHRTQESTKEIEAMVSAVQQSSSESVRGMRVSSEQAEKTQDVAKAAGEALQTIAIAVSQISERNASIASAAEEQAHVAKDVDKNLVTIQDLAGQTASGANQTSSSSQELARLAVNLNELVSSFRL